MKKSKYHDKILHLCEAFSFQHRIAYDGTDFFLKEWDDGHTRHAMYVLIDEMNFHINKHHCYDDYYSYDECIPFTFKNHKDMYTFIKLSIENIELK